MLSNPKAWQSLHQSVKGNNNSAQISTQINQFYPYPSSQSSKNSKRSKDGHAYSTDQQEGPRDNLDTTSSILIYGQELSINFHSDASIHSFLQEIQKKNNIGQLTKESLKILVLEKAVNRKKNLRPLLQDAYQKYENMRIKSIFN